MCAALATELSFMRAELIPHLWDFYSQLFLRRLADWPRFQGLPTVRLLKPLKGRGKAV